MLPLSVRTTQKFLPAETDITALSLQRHLECGIIGTGTAIKNVAK